MGCAVQCVLYRCSGGKVECLGLLVQVEENAEPAAQAVSDQAIRPAGKAVAENAGPAAKSATDSTIRPAGQAVSDNAVPVTKSAMRDQVGSSMRLSAAWVHVCMAESCATFSAEVFMLALNCAFVASCCKRFIFSQ